MDSTNPILVREEAFKILKQKIEKLTQDISDMDNEEVEELRKTLQITKEELETEIKGTTAMGNNYGNTLTEIVEKYGSLQSLVIALQETVNTIRDNTAKLETNITTLKTAIESGNGGSTGPMIKLEETEAIETATKIEFKIDLKASLHPFFDQNKSTFTYEVINEAHKLSMTLFMKESFHKILVNNSGYTELYIQNLPIIPRSKMPTQVYSDIVAKYNQETTLANQGAEAFTIKFNPNDADGFFKIVSWHHKKAD